MKCLLHTHWGHFLFLITDQSVSPHKNLNIFKSIATYHSECSGEWFTCNEILVKLFSLFCVPLRHGRANCAGQDSEEG
jgi:hypothetical protein